MRADPEALGSICAHCHAPQGEPISPTLVCWFETEQEVARGPTPDATCASCHMPTTERPAAIGAPEVTLRRHLWDGGGVPKDAEGYDRLLQTGWEPALDVAVSLDPLVVTLTNARAAHALPTGDPERHLAVEARLESAEGTVLARDTLRIGQRWDWGDEGTRRIAHRLEDDRLAPGEARRWTPTLAASAAEALVVEVTSVRLTAENARGMATASLDPELVRLHPEAVVRLPEIERWYPLGTVVYRERIPLDGSDRRSTPLAELLAESRARLGR